jgi:hypothetical protein
MHEMADEPPVELYPPAAHPGLELLTFTAAAILAIGAARYLINKVMGREADNA